MDAETAPDRTEKRPRRDGDKFTRAGKIRLLSLENLDSRTAAYKDCVKLVKAIESDLGGPTALSTGERELVKRCGVLGALLADTEARWIEGEPIDPTTYCTVINAQRRLFEVIGLQRRPRLTPSVAQYVEHVAATEEADA